MKLSLITKALGELLVANHYSASTVDFYLTEWKKMGDFLLAEFKDEEFDLAKGLTYLEKRYRLSERYANGKFTEYGAQLLRGIQLLEGYRLHGVLVRRINSWKNPIVLEGEFANVYERFAKSKEGLGWASSTLKLYCIIAKEFLNYLQQLGLSSPLEVRLEDCHSYLKTLEGFAVGTIERRVTGLRRLLGFMFAEGMIGTDMAINLHMPPISKTASIPSNWTQEELKKLLGSVDRNSPIGKRDYAMLLLGCVLGLRSGDVKNLRFGNFDWEAKKLNFVQHKTHKPLELPVPDSVGWAIIDYIRNGRPNFHENDYVFVLHRPPFSQISQFTSLTMIVKKYRVKAGIKRPKKRSGFHSLRHSAASLLLAMETPLPIITEILGHTSPDTTAVYLKTDLLKLAQCILEPEDFKDED